ncbi:AraC family transcriptional regulator [Thermocoleostomius sinensis A174]|uniref:AraC family transcriptional regulator n=2 Tax=Thermocoleostomius TaxID=3065395 RepID=A0A9E8ZB05_9CYAN|nr:AraC family transcriptional regulator [Thermocoleostomius sinensis A174]
MMKTFFTHLAEATDSPILSSQSQGWNHILVEQFQHPPGEERSHFDEEHAICLSLAPRPVRLLQIKGGRTYVGLQSRGDVSLTPAKIPSYFRWESDDSCLHIRIASQFIQNVARETIATDPDRLELRLEFQTRDPQLEAIGMMMLAELKQEHIGGRLYIESLSNLLAVHLLRQYAASTSRFIVYESGLTERQIRQIIEYIDAHLNQDIKLADLATLLGISESHLSHRFKQAIGITPYQYLLQQRIERAKQLLKEGDRSIMDIALLCGFNSHSHLSKQFRQLTGMTPKNYRTS